VLDGKVNSKPVQSQKAEGAVQNANRAGAANAPNTREKVIAARTTGIAIYNDDQQHAGEAARETLEKK
jgi:hypothetical protein